MRIRLQTRVFRDFVLLVLMFGVLCAVLGGYLIGHTVLREAQRRVSLDLRSAWSVLDSELKELRVLVAATAARRQMRDAASNGEAPLHRADFEVIRRLGDLDFIGLTDNEGTVLLRGAPPYETGDDLSGDPIIYRALHDEPTSHIAILGQERLVREGRALQEQAFIAFEPTPKAKPRAKAQETSGMVMEAAAPVRDPNGNVLGCVYGGVLLNRNYEMVDGIRSIVFQEETYEGQPLGTVTIFQWDVRIATNVMKEKGQRAIATRVSQEVYDQVLENDKSWYDRAFVVRDWYISAYDPIHDVDGDVIGILYVGVLEEKYEDIKAGLWRIYAVFAGCAAVLTIVVGFWFSRHLTGSLSRLAHAADRIAAGELDHQVPEPRTDDEIRDLTRDFNAMADRLREREQSLRSANAELERLNTNYLDMLGFVSHELKNTLGVIYTAARSLDSGLVGKLTDPQARMAGSIRRSIDKAVSMTRNYLDLSRIEKGEFAVEKEEVRLIRDVVNPLLDQFTATLAEHDMTLENELPDRLTVAADPNALQIVFKNLIGNALKYGRKGGTIRLGFREEPECWRFNVWNEGDAPSPERLEELFRKFARVEKTSEAGRKGTGLGLFITRQIIEAHGGRAYAESQEGQWIDFVFTLPKEPHQEGAAGQVQPDRAPSDC